MQRGLEAEDETLRNKRHSRDGTSLNRHYDAYDKHGC